ncbi:hypothetical protein HOF65_04475 [bacterium]|nr:hypothetical protein [bacterium]MBT3853217.1 hypothetical protein [bacterium]MBT4633370.1 hypothetical protein [bacterium]MBT6779482.1 hypothetical protein [bacterium]
MFFKTTRILGHIALSNFFSIGLIASFEIIDLKILIMVDEFSIHSCTASANSILMNVSFSTNFSSCT